MLIEFPFPKDLPAEEDIPKRTNEPEQLPASLEPSSILPSSQEVQVTEIEGELQ